jgi:preprotein translocase subunit SecE
MAAQETAIQTNTSRWKKFLREVKAELKKVTWPGKSELISFTGVVFVTVTVVAALIWVLDASFAQVLKAIIK